MTVLTGVAIFIIGVWVGAGMMAMFKGGHVDDQSEEDFKRIIAEAKAEKRERDE